MPSMPVCDLCQGNEYYEEGGLFFCNECHTQSQSMIVMEDDVTPGHMPPPGARREVCRKRKNKEGSEYEVGRPWTRYEAYQLILQGQADALIAHGAHPKIKEAIERLYFYYLSKLEVAFVGRGKKPRLIPKGLENSPETLWLRELRGGGVDNPEIDLFDQNQTRRESDSISKKPKKRNADSAGDAPVSIEREMFCENDDTLEENDGGLEGLEFDSQLPLFSDMDASSDEEEDDDDDDVGSKTGKSGTAEQKFREAWQRIEYMTLRKTLAFLYVGCLFESPWITLSDILWWINDGSLPYLETTHLLQSDMKLTVFDHRLFWPRRVTAKTVLLDAGKLLHLLKIETLPPLPVKDIAIKYTFILDLPRALLPAVVSMLRRYPVDCGYHVKENMFQAKALPSVDALCAAYILVALKAVFGLDDCREMLLTDYTNRVQEKIGGDIHLFNWSKWQSHATRKFLCGSGAFGRQPREGPVKALCQVFERTRYKERQYNLQKTFTLKKKVKVASFRQENRELLKQPMNILEERWRNREATAARIREQEAKGRDANSPGTSEEEEAARFSASSIEHLKHPADFLHSCLGQGNNLSTAMDGEQSLIIPNGQSPASRTNLSTESCEHCSSLCELTSTVTCDEQQKKRGESWPRDCMDSNSSSEDEEEKRQWRTVTKRGNERRTTAESESSMCVPGPSSSSTLRVDSCSPAACQRRQSTGNRHKCSCHVERESPDVESDVEKTIRERMNNGSERDNGNKETVTEKVKTTGDCEPISEVQQLLEMYKQVSDDFWLCAIQKDTDPYRRKNRRRCQIPQYYNYKWLLQVLSALTHCTDYDIQTMVLKVEQQMLELNRGTEPSGATEQSNEESKS